MIFCCCSYFHYFSFSYYGTHSYDGISNSRVTGIFVTHEPLSLSFFSRRTEYELAYDYPYYSLSTPSLKPYDVELMVKSFPLHIPSFRIESAPFMDSSHFDEFTLFPELVLPSEIAPLFRVPQSGSIDYYDSRPSFSFYYPDALSLTSYLRSYKQPFSEVYCVPLPSLHFEILNVDGSVAKIFIGE